MKSVALFIVLACMVLAVDAAYANHHYEVFTGQNAQQNSNANKQVKRSKQRAMQIAENRSGGRAVAIRLTGDGQSYRVRVLLANGTVKHILVLAYD